ncbi:hypothetical protein Taro_056076 [Colocasia esculenta]|uniref:Uncharacterized protein n=1 Tax=Colocasia esculenta TaxID=4460 RepID=A0A843XSZ1_COLES|nr:hypothetical protein [Colocasia esculenta]
MLPSPCVHVCMVCGRHGIEDPVGLPPYWCRDGSARRDIRGGISPFRRDLIATRLAVVMRPSRRASQSRHAVRACLGWPTTLLRLRVCLSLAGLVMCYKPVVQRGIVVLPRLFARCSTLEGLSPV